jgi:hypothetical protein
MIKFEDFYQIETKPTWQDLLNFYDGFSPYNDHLTSDWMFRGHSDAGWPLNTSLERAITNSGSSLSSAADMEKGLIDRFKRQAKSYLQSIPDDENYMEWLALMQHHGAPTRLQDWTHSFFVAAFFAAIDQKAGADAAIWALNWRSLDAIWKKNPKWNEFEKDKNLQKAATFECFCDMSAQATKVNAYQFNDRLRLQQGTFIAPTDITRSLEDNLIGSLTQIGGRNSLIKIIFPHSARAGILRELYRMNMTSCVLFSDFDGFARSLLQYIVIPELLYIDSPISK